MRSNAESPPLIESKALATVRCTTRGECEIMNGMSLVFDRIQSEDFEQVVYCNDPRTGLKAIISMHSTVLGPATGGCRMWAYQDESEALTDVLRLSKGMTY